MIRKYIVTFQDNEGRLSCTEFDNEFEAINWAYSKRPKNHEIDGYKFGITVKERIVYMEG